MPVVFTWSEARLITTPINFLAPKKIIEDYTLEEIMPTIRQSIIDLLEQEELNAIDISQTLSIREKEVYEHLAHISRTLKAKQQKLIVNPYCCLNCGYEFTGRQQFTRPGRCPNCKGGHIKMASYRINNR